MERCEHHWCRCIRATELMWMADRARDHDTHMRLLREAIEVHGSKVPCRQYENKGTAHEQIEGH